MSPSPATAHWAAWAVLAVGRSTIAGARKTALLPPEPGRVARPISPRVLAALAARVAMAARVATAGRAAPVAAGRRVVVALPRVDLARAATAAKPGKAENPAKAASASRPVRVAEAETQARTPLLARARPVRRP